MNAEIFSLNARVNTAISEVSRFTEGSPEFSRAHEELQKCFDLVLPMLSSDDQDRLATARWQAQVAGGGHPGLLYLFNFYGQTLLRELAHLSRAWVDPVAASAAAEAVRHINLDPSICGEKGPKLPPNSNFAHSVIARADLIMGQRANFSNQVYLGAKSVGDDVTVLHNAWIAGAVIEDGVTIEALARVGEPGKLGKKTRLGSQANAGDGFETGEGDVLEAFVEIKNNFKMGGDNHAFRHSELGPDGVMGSGNEIHAHARVKAKKFGNGNKIGEGAKIDVDEVGNNNIIGESVKILGGKIGSGNTIEDYTVLMDCLVGDDATIRRHCEITKQKIENGKVFEPHTMIR